ncbi:MAG: amylo-alpha-1,6-glucosidase [Chloroflexota bacterium]|nr:amylo-alpha-1,6-glucosidase [Chloroflexota bacterium]
MTFEIRVGSRDIHISHGNTFLVCNHRGEVADGNNQGIYAADTRFVSIYQLFINRQPWKEIDASQLDFYAARFHLTNPPVHTAGGAITKHTLDLTINREIGAGIYENFEIVNYAGKEVAFILEVEIRSDFADIFEVKSGDIVQRGSLVTTWDHERKRLCTVYDHKDFHRVANYQVLSSDGPVSYANGRLFFDITLAQNQTWHARAVHVLEHGQQIDPSIYTSSEQGQPEEKFKQQQARWHSRCTEIVTSNSDVQQMYRQAVADMGALRIYNMDVSEDAWVPAAGVPWFVTLFGRDSLIVSYQNMSVSPDFARGALKRLGERQATKRDDWHDAQPGKILHELRFGELAHFNQIPFDPYYGTADATILYLIVLSETYRWTGDVSLLKEFRHVAEGCLDWIDHYGDLDGDGFQEYKTFSSQGAENMAWKDSGYSVVYADGSQVKQPKGTCELQGYVYDAKMRMAEVFQVLGDEERAKTLQQQAEALKRKFNEVFWMEDEGCFAFGLDADKNLITSIASNAGQCLWSGIADQDKAERTAKRLLQDDMWSGWGIRTLASTNPAYNPLAYQRGAIWPHDNGIVAAGFKRYGLAKEANQVIGAVFDATQHFDADRPPEVFAGVQRKSEVDFPVLYPGGANIPQAWATGSIFHMVRTVLGLRADAPHHRLYVNPTLPDWLPEIELQQLRVGPCLIDLHFWREGDHSRWETRRIKGDHGTPQDKMIQVMSVTRPR